MWEWPRSGIKSCRPRSTCRLGRAPKFPPGFLRPASESGPVGRWAALRRSEAGPSRAKTARDSAPLSHLTCDDRPEEGSRCPRGAWGTHQGRDQGTHQGVLGGPNQGRRQVQRIVPRWSFMATRIAEQHFRTGHDTRTRIALGMADSLTFGTPSSTNGHTESRSSTADWTFALDGRHRCPPAPRGSGKADGQQAGGRRPPPPGPPSSTTSAKHLT
jgi:hypothetical protein